jgi:DNA-binding NarL/FixJ family response regulator
MVEDYEPYRAYVASLLERRPQLKVVDEASEGLQAIEKARQYKPDLILMDVGLPRLNGIEAARQIRKESPHSRILFLSQDNAPELIAAAMEAGGSGYVSKSEAEADLLDAIDAVLRGGQYFNSRNS